MIDSLVSAENRRFENVCQLKVDEREEEGGFGQFVFRFVANDCGWWQSKLSRNQQNEFYFQQSFCGFLAFS